MWVKHLSQHRDHKFSVGKYWHRAGLKLGEDGKHWSRVKGPMTAAIATLIDIGWDPISPFIWADTSGDRWQLGGNDVSGLVKEITKT
eukprot:11663107-Heterocapsa_arctica.AAC.1